MSPALSKLRRTGRTTRMLEHAKRLAAEGRKVRVVTDNYNETRRLEALFGHPDLYVRFETLLYPGEFDWARMQFTTRTRSEVVLVDHYAIERHLSRALAMLHAYDEPPAPKADVNSGKRKILT